MHWAAHGKTAAEVITERSDASRPNMGLTTWAGSRPKKSDAGIAKNYLAHDEIDSLNLIVSAYLDFAEIQAKGRKPMYMKDWITKLDSFLKLGDLEVLSHAGKISHEEAMKKAELEYEKFRIKQDELPASVDLDFDRAVDEIKKIGSQTDKRISSRSKKMPTKRRK